MKNLFKVLWIIAIVAIIGFSFAACDDGSGGTDGSSGSTGGDGQTLTYKGTSGGTEWVLKITGDAYELTDGLNTSTGSVSQKQGTTYYLKPLVTATMFTATVTSNGGLVELLGTIIWYGGGTPEALPGQLTPVGDNGGGDYTGGTDETDDNGGDEENEFFISNGVLTGYHGNGGIVTIPNNVISIGGDIYGNGAFSGCTSLTSVTIGNNVINIGNGAFFDCDNLTSVTFTPTSKVTSIGIRAFGQCYNLTSVTIPDSVNSIGHSAFEWTNLTSVTIGNSVISIGEYAFHGTTSLTSVTFETGSNITDANFGEGAFPEGSDGFGGNTLKTAYSTGKAGTYTRGANGYWTKQ